VALLILYQKSTPKVFGFHCFVGVLLHEDRNYDDPLKHNTCTFFLINRSISWVLMLLFVISGINKERLIVEFLW